MVPDPLTPVGLHEQEVEAIAGHGTDRLESGLAESTLGADVVDQRVQVYAFQLRLGERVVQHGDHRVRAVALSPVGAVTYHDAEFRLAPGQIDVVVHAVADVAALERVDGQAERPRTRVGQVVRVQLGVLSEAEVDRRGGIQRRQLRIYAPGIVGRGVLGQFQAQDGQLPLKPNVTHPQRPGSLPWKQLSPRVELHLHT